MKKVNFTDDETQVTLVAVKMAGAAHTALLSMCPSSEIRHMLMTVMTNLPVPSESWRRDRQWSTTGVG